MAKFWIPPLTEVDSPPAVLPWPPLTDWYEQIEKCIGWLGALAAAGPYAVAYAADEKHPYEWVENLVWLAKELTRETEQRMDRLAKAIGIQNDRLEKQQACRTEG